MSIEGPTLASRLDILREARQALTDVRGEKDCTALAKLCEFRRMYEPMIRRLERGFPAELKEHHAVAWEALEALAEGRSSDMDLMTLRRYVQRLVLEARNDAEDDFEMRCVAAK